jgi:hypothetical protein
LKLLEKLEVIVLKHWRSETVWNTLLAITAV